MSAADAYEAVLDTAGAWPRDAVDARLVAEVRTGTGSLKSSVPAYPSIASGTSVPGCRQGRHGRRMGTGAGA